MGILPRSNQEHLGRVSAKRPASGGLFTGVRHTGHNGETVPQGIYWDGGSAGSVVGGECGELEIFGGHNGRGGGQASIDRLCRPAEVPLSGVGFCAAHHPGHRDGIPYCGVRAVCRVLPSPL